MKKAFTLIELLAVIVLIGIIGLISMPIIAGTISENKENLYAAQLEEISAATDKWAYRNLNLLPQDESDIVTITLSDLKKGGFLGIDLKDPRTGELLPNDLIIRISYKDNKYNYEVDGNSGTNVTDDFNINAPTIVLNGNNIEYVEMNGAYAEKGAIAKDNSGNTVVVTTQYKDNDTEISSITTNTLKTFTVIYSATVKIGNEPYTSHIVRTVVVRDTTAPVLTIPSDLTINEANLSGFNLLTGVSATDNSNEEIAITTSGFNTLPSKHIVSYTACDSNNNCTTKKRIITITKMGAPTLTVPTATLTVAQGSTIDLLLGVTAVDGLGNSIVVTCKVDGGSCATSTLSFGNHTIVYYATDMRNNTTTSNRALTITCPYSIGQVINFDYTGAVQNFSASCTGNYKLEVWGAQGGNGGGYGGYSIGTYNVSSSINLYVYVGGAGNLVSASNTLGTTAYGGWNGGGGASQGNCSHAVSSGGGGTDISTSSSPVALDSYGRYVKSSYANRLIVAGGGGGTGGYGTGGAGGGFTGMGTYPGTQSSAGAITQNSITAYAGGLGFGAGTWSTSTDTGGCWATSTSGGGYYGGGYTGAGNNASGGSGYIGGVLSNATYSITKAMYCYSCTTSAATDSLTYSTTNVSATATTNYAKTGNGYAKITYLGP